MPESERPRCLQVDVDVDELDLVSGLLWSGGVTAIQELPLGPGRVRLVAGLPLAAEHQLVASLQPRWTPDTFAAEYDGWLDAWRPFARPVRVGFLVVHPPWEPPDDSGPDDLLVAIDPGRSFGQGNHPTTRLVLSALTDAVKAGKSVLDVGCGSGVLAVTAARLGAGRVVVLDIEAQAVEAARENARRNGVGDRIDCSATAVADIDGGFDVVLANILAPVLIELAPAIGERVAVRGVLLLSGLLTDQRSDVLAAYRPDFTLAPSPRDGDWCLLELRRDV